MTAKEIAPISSAPTTSPYLEFKELHAIQSHPALNTPALTTLVSQTTTLTPRIPTSLRHLHPRQLHLSVIVKVPAQISTLLITQEFKEWVLLLLVQEAVGEVVEKDVDVNHARMNLPVM